MTLAQRFRSLLVLCVPLLLATGCAQIPLGEPAPRFSAIEKAAKSRTAPVVVGPFQTDPRANPSIDKDLSVRSNAIVSPVNGSFAQYLRQTLIVDLQAAGLLDPKSPTEIRGFLTESTLDVPVQTGQASLGARFQVLRQGTTVYDKTLKVQSNWPSSFVGAVAIPDGINQYAALYHDLVEKLLDDPDYRQANQK